MTQLAADTWSVHDLAPPAGSGPLANGKNCGNGKNGGNGKNRLFYGDNLDLLRVKIADETVDLCYIDPPFNSKRTYNQIYNNVGSEDRAQEQAFVDTWTWDDHAREGYPEIISNGTGRYHPQTIELLKGFRNVLGEGSLLAYLISMTRRFVEIHRVLKSTGSFYVHCDPTASHYLKLILDSVFCTAGGDFTNEIVWQRTSAHNDPSRYGRVHDVLLFYCKSRQRIWNQQYDAPDDAYFAAHDFERDENGRLYRKRDLTAPAHGRSSGQYDWKGRRPPSGRMWSYTEENMRKLEAEGRVVYTRTGMPRLKIYAEDLRGVPLQDVWASRSLWLNSAANERLDYPTQKPEALMERIIQTSSNPDDVVLDAFCGCGTTIAVAERLGRRWIGMDITYQSIALILKRLEDSLGKAAADAVVLDGVPRDMASAHALAHKLDDRVRKEFEKWAVLTYTSNRAAINYKKGADAGIDGTAYFWTGKDTTEKAVFQVKSGGVGRGDIAKLKGDMQREKASVGTLITLEEPTQPMREEAKRAGMYLHPMTTRKHDRVEIVTILELLDRGRRFDLPMNIDVLKTAPAAPPSEEQGELPLLRRLKTKMARANLPLNERRKKRA